ncbi:hypothetical protein [Gilvibacter sp.]|uniref:hypothetical protein n=1 Tax=Gilvibacter sp. TaxID=2729997 RepID=UPI0025C1551D|nr:hypothetical protein [Gilvibacter sp.]
MQTLVFTFALMISVAFGVTAQTPYQKGMQKALTTWGEDKPMEASNIFERIANVETDQWLPAYYVALINTIESYEEMDLDKRTAMLNKAQEYLNLAKGVSPSNPELLVVEAQWYISWVAFDGEKYGMQYAPKVAAIYQKAAKIDPENPRVAMGKLEWDMGSASFFGQDPAEFCEDLQKAILLYDNFQASEEFYPQHGKGYGLKVIDRTCNN